jgi:hypothetical protein
MAKSINKAVLSNRIYLNVNDDLVEILERTLTYEIEQKTGNPLDSNVLIIRNAIRINKDLYSIPSGRADLIPSDYTIVDKQIKLKANFPKFKFTLRPSQQRYMMK